MDDITLTREILAALDWEPAVEPAAVGVTVKDGVVTLFGHVASLPERYAVERAVLRVRGVVAVANEVEVALPADRERTDEQIARRVVEALESSVYVPHERVRAMVRHGTVVLSGEVDWKYQRDAAAASVSSLSGVKQVVNEIMLRSHPRPPDLKERVEQALARSAEIDTGTIAVDLVGGRIILRGAARTWAEREEAERIAWGAPGVVAVENELVVQVPVRVAAPAVS